MVDLVLYLMDRLKKDYCLRVEGYTTPTSIGVFLRIYVTVDGKEEKFSSIEGKLEELINEMANQEGKIFTKKMKATMMDELKKLGKSNLAK